MLSDLLELFSLVSPSHKRKLLYIQACIFFMAMAELLTVFSIVPFMAVISDPSILFTNQIFISAITFLNIEIHENNVIFYLGLLVIATVLLSTLISVLTVWYINIQAAKIGFELASSLYKNYMTQTWTFHTLNHSSKLTNKIMNEGSRLTSHIITPILQMNARLVVILFIVGGLIIASPVIAILSVSTFSLAYLTIFYLIRRKLEKNSITLTSEGEKRVKLINEGFGGIKETLILGRQYFFINRFVNSSNKVARAGALNQAFSQMPRYALEFLAFVGLVSIVLAFHVLNDGSINSILPIVSVFAIAAFKLLPAFQILFSAISMIQGNISAIHSIKGDLDSSNNLSRIRDKDTKNKLHFENEITFSNISFSYPGKDIPAISNINISNMVNYLSVYFFGNSHVETSVTGFKMKSGYFLFFCS